MANTTQERITDWLNRLIGSETPPASIVAFNFGLFETEEGYGAYLIGATAFDPADDDWACDEAYTPRERYLMLPREVSQAQDWRACLEVVVQGLRAFLASEAGRDSFLGRAAAVTVGFDDGDLIRVR